MYLIIIYHFILVLFCITFKGNIQTRFQKSWDTVQIVNKKECNNLQIS